MSKICTCAFSGVSRNSEGPDTQSDPRTLLIHDGVNDLPGRLLTVETKKRLPQLVCDACIASQSDSVLTRKGECLAVIITAKDTSRPPSSSLHVHDAGTGAGTVR